MCSTGDFSCFVTSFICFLSLEGDADDNGAAAGSLLPVFERGRPRPLVPLDDDAPDDEDDFPGVTNGGRLSKRVDSAAAAPDDDDEVDDAGGNGAPLLALVG